MMLRWSSHGLRLTKLTDSTRTLFFSLFAASSHNLSRKLQHRPPPRFPVSNYSSEDSEFLPWLEQKAGAEISDVLAIGKSAYGRTLIASEKITTGDCILRVPFSVQISPDNLLPEIRSQLGDEVGKVAKVATVVLIEQRKGQDSEWYPYISRLPRLTEMQNTIFWSPHELEMIRQSSVYEETVNKKAEIRREFMQMKIVLKRTTNLFEDIAFEDFMHSYALVESRAWESSKGYSLIPFADFLNYDGLAEAIVLSDESKEISEVIADRDYSSGQQVLISYGKFSNAVLLLDFGFTIPHNIYDEVQIQLNIPHSDPLYNMKLELLVKHCLPSTKDNSCFKSAMPFTIKEVKSTKGKGRGIPQSLRAAGRILCCTSAQELSSMAEEASKNDGRLGRRPLKDISKEIQAHHILLAQITRLIDEYDSSIKLLGAVDSTPGNKQEIRKSMAYHLLVGELCVLKSASAWLENYIMSLLQHSVNDARAVDQKLIS